VTLSTVNKAPARQFTRHAKQEATPHATLRTMRPMQRGLLFPDLEPMMRRMRARAEHLAKLRAKRQRITAARMD
jgi:hypothetical protein